LRSILRGRKRFSFAGPRGIEEPIRSELFSVERLDQHAESLAIAQRVTTRAGAGRPLAARLRDNGRVLLAAYRTIASAIREEGAITPAAAWLVDNFHVVEEQIREVHDDLPRGFYRQLPKLAEGPLAGYPRVFGVAWAFVAHTDSRFDPQTFCRFVRAYQRVQPLTIGELWAVAITLRIVLIENLRRAAERIVSKRAARQEADALADSLLGMGGSESRAAATTLRDLERSAGAAPCPDRRVMALADLAQGMADAMEFGFLFDPTRQLLSIGYLVTEGTLDPSCYDLLASEARLASFVAIAKGDVPARHWFRLGRALTPVDRGSALVSWSGSMFEYLMPSLVMRAPAGSLLEQTSRLVVRRQMTYGAKLGVPWGVSESAYNARDLELTYQYSNFGVPGLGLKRGLSEDTVVAPYATALAAMVDPQAAARNFSRLGAAGGRGRYGYYEALDYTRTRVPEDEPVAVVRAYMAHHQGMTLVAIANALQDGAMRARFHSEPIIQATELLLQERMPRNVAVARPRAEEVKTAANVREIIPAMQRRFHSPHDAVPRTHLLSNGRYAVMITAAGSGYSRWRELAITRWREDATCDAWGAYVFLRDASSGAVWSAGYQPSGVEPDSYEVEFSEDRVEIVRRDGTISTVLDVAVSPEDDAEVRRVSISNLGSRAREIELTSYAEIVLAPPAADAAHPAFSKLFVQTELAAGALLATRRRRSPAEPEVWTAHLAVVEGEAVGDVQFETDRARFLGRGREIRTPMSVIDGGPLTNTVGAVLDPIFSLRRRVRVSPGATARVAFWTLIAPSRGEALDLVDKHQDPTAFERVVTLAWTQAQVQLHHLGVGPDEAQLFQRLANHVLYSDPTLRPSSAVLRRSERGQSALWAHGISGDVPIVFVRIDEGEDVEVVRQLLRAHEYWRMKQLGVDLVILNERSTSYVQDLQVSLETAVRQSQSRPRPEGEGARGSVFVLRADLVSLEVRHLLQTAARAVLRCHSGSLAEQLTRLGHGIRRVGACRIALRRGGVRRHRDRSGDGSDAGTKSLEQRVRQPRGLRRSGRAAARLDGRPHGVPRPQPHSRPSGRACCGSISLRSSRRRCRPVRRPANPDRSGARRHGRGRLLPRRGGDQGGGACADPALSRRRPRRCPAGGDRSLGGCPGCSAGANTGSFHGRSAEPLAALPDARLPRVGAIGVLSGERSVRLSRPVAGRHGAHDVLPRAHAGAPVGRRRAAVRRGRRAALVAAVVGPGSADADLRRSDLVALRRRPLRRGHGRSRRSRRVGFLSRRAGAGRWRARLVLPADGFRRACLAVRALCSRSRTESFGR
jgi:hypothetical protein